MPQDPTTSPVQEAIRFTVLYANVYANRDTGELELGARVYRNPSAADERRRTHPTRNGLVFVGVFPVSAAVPDSVRRSALDAAGRDTGASPADQGEDEPQGNDGSNEEGR